MDGDDLYWKQIAEMWRKKALEWSRENANLRGSLIASEARAKRFKAALIACGAMSDDSLPSKDGPTPIPGPGRNVMDKNSF